MRVELRDDGTIDACDKVTDRRLFEGPGNRLVNYRDHPREFEAWDVEGDIYAVGDDLPAPKEVEVIETGSMRATIRQTREFGDSMIVQDISLDADSRRIDFRTEVDWHEEEKLLKAHFPMAVHANEATYDIQFGHLERDTHENTTWEEAQFEERHHQWVDVSEHDYGISVINDCTYGVNVDGTDVSLSLLRAPESPDSTADRGRHEFQSSLYPHEGDLRDGGVVETGYEVNTPARAIPVAERVEYSPFALDTAGIVVESIKRAEDHDDALVARLYEAYGRQADATIEFGFPVSAAAETNLIEDREGQLVAGTDNVDIEFGPFEIQTLLVELDEDSI